MLNKKSAEPLFEQLVKVLRKEISCNYSAGDKFLTDRRLCQEYQVSLPVVRSALAILVKEGMLERVPPKGTFVTDKKLNTSAGTCFRIGVVCPLESYLPHIDAIRGIQRYIEDASHETILIENPERNKPDSELIADIVRHKIGDLDGIIWVSSVMAEVTPNNFLRRIADKIVLLNAKIKSGELTSIMADCESAEYQLTSHLIEQGRQRIAFIGGPEKRLAAQKRYSGFETAMSDAGCQLKSNIIRPFIEKECPDVMEKEIRAVLSSGDSVDAVIVFNDHMARQAVSVISEMGKKVPDDIAVVGFDDRPTPDDKLGLTTALIPFEEMGKLAANALIQQLAGKRNAGGVQYLACPITLRESTTL